MSKRFKAAVLVLGSTFALVGLACGGSDDGSIPNSDAGVSPDGAGQPASDGGLPTSVDGAVQPGTDASSAETGPADGAVQPGPDGGVVPTDGSAGDGATPPVDASTRPDAEPPFTGIACGNNVCHVGTEVCCNRQTGGGRGGVPGGREEVCVAQGACEDGGQPIACNKPSDCASGQTCCATYQPGIRGTLGSITEVSCAASCERGGADGGAQHYTVCDRNMRPACDGPNEQCSQSLSLAPIVGLLVCQRTTP